MKLFARGAIVRSRLDGDRLGMGFVEGPAERELHSVKTETGDEWHRMYLVRFLGTKNTEERALTISGFWLENGSR